MTMTTTAEHSPTTTRGFAIPHTKNSNRPQNSLKLSLPPPPSPDEIFDDGQWFWYEGKRVRAHAPGRRSDGRDIVEKEAECPDGELEYDCGYLDLGAESPHSGSNSPYFGSSNPSGTEKQANAGSQKDPIEEESRPNGGQQEPASDGRSVASQATDQRLIREWAISIVAGKQGDAGLPPAIANIPLRSSRPSSRRGSVSGKKPVQKKYADRDCGICFEYAVKPSRTLCCSKIFCSEHLRDWLKGPNATGLCPNCDAPCSIDENTLSLASPTLRTGNGKSASTSPTSSRPPPSQQYERLMAQQHVPSSPLSTSAPITHHRRNSAEAVPVPASISTPRRSTGTGTGFSLYPGPPHTAAPGLERDCEANLDRHTIPFPFAPRSTNDSLGGESYVDLRKEGKSLTSEKDSEQGWSEDPSSFLSLPLSDCLGLDKEGRESTRPRTPSMWSTGTMGKAVLARAPGRKTSAFDTVFGPNADTFGSLAHLATLVAFVLLMYVVLA
ncbi:hypothetical protein FA15DRAFT_504996 [Coprinopsis marcescibilis]|uniref:RING-type domain-containing protein n=1 Tax=Coprinopsis marcescibilis TaxID=230819 RepID=A0A5C3KQN1_COPMA|nr:hypothetical protein FA15DRAFT_504996 [Coprinopsis marcescibilis]